MTTRRPSRLGIIRGLALGFWLACVLYVVLPSTSGSKSKPAATFERPVLPQPQMRRPLQQ